jgi:hypothetical protein
MSGMEAGHVRSAEYVRDRELDMSGMEAGHVRSAEYVRDRDRTCPVKTILVVP